MSASNRTILMTFNIAGKFVNRTRVAGDETKPVIVKLMFLPKHALVGYSGVQVVTVQRMLDLFNNDILPVVYDKGSLGASGDLAPLANLFLPLIGVGDVYYKGAKRDIGSVLDEFGWEPIKLKSKEGLALLNGTQFMSAHGVYAIMKAQRLSKRADLIAAISIDSYDGHLEPFDERLHLIRPHIGQLETSQNIRKFLEGSELISAKETCSRPLFVSMCAASSWSYKDAIAYAKSVLLTEINRLPIIPPFS